MTGWDRVERLLGSDNLSRLAKAKVGVIGLGSGGGFVAQSLAMSGVGNFVLVDDDIIEESNVVRHVADRTHLGRPKAEVLAELIIARNPNATADVRTGKIEDHMDALDDLDIVLVGVDQEQVKYIINEACLEKNIPAVYAGVFERGEGGDVVLLRPDGLTRPCYACWAAELREGLVLTQLSDGQELDYGMIGEGGTLEAEPGLWLHVVRVASAQADMAVNELLRGTAAHEEMPGNTVIMANRSIEIIEGVITSPYSAVWTTIRRDPNCLVCGDDIRRRKRLADAESEEDAISLDDLMGSVGIAIEDSDE
ncbi:MAG: ThiF family adenylyltransferase [Chloroflexota bacterium]